MIIDLAEYWPRIIVRRDTKHVTSASYGRVNDATWCYLVTPPIPGLEMSSEVRPPVGRTKKNVRFWTRSHDHGWGGVSEMRGTSRHILLI